jgi:hypothetical protein
MPIIKIEIDTTQLKLRTEKEKRKLAYAVAKASNDTAVEVQTAERVNLDRKFTLRRAGFMYRLIKITFAKVREARPFAEIFIDRTKQRVLLGFFEGGGVKDPAVGKRVAVPLTGSPARPSFSNPVTAAYEYSKLRLKQANARGKRRGKKAAKVGSQVWKGKNRTFMLPQSKSAPEGAVFQRIGPKRGDIVELYEFVTKPKLKERLDFVDVARKVYVTRWEPNFRKAMAYYDRVFKG